jgi:hypothetical protein
MAEQFKITVDIPGIPSSLANQVIGRKLRMMLPEREAVEKSVAFAANSVTLDGMASDGQKLHLELVNEISGTHGGSEQAHRDLIVGKPIPDAKLGELVVRLGAE